MSAVVMSAVDVQGDSFRNLFEKEYDTTFISPQEFFEKFKINYITKINSSTSKGRSKGRSKGTSVNQIRGYVVSDLHSLLIQPLPRDTSRYILDLQYEPAPDNVTRITGTDCVPQHAYYSLIVKTYELFLYEPRSKHIFNRLHRDVTDFITEQLNIGIQEGREFFENKIKVFLSKHPDFLKVTDENVLRERIQFLYDLLRTDKLKNVNKTYQRGVVSTISRDDVEKYSLESHVTVSQAAKDAFEKTVYGFHVSLCIGDYLVSMSLDRMLLFPNDSVEENEDMSFSFFNSEILLYMSSQEFITQVMKIIENYYTNPLLGGIPESIQRMMVSADHSHEVTFFECGCKSLCLYNSTTGKYELDTNTKLPGRAEHIVSTDQHGNYYLLVHNFPSMGIMSTLNITGGNLPTYDEQGANVVLRIQFGDTSNDSMETLRHSQPSSLTDDDQEQNDTPVEVEAGAAAAAAAGAVNMVGTVDSVEAVEVGRKRSAVEAINPNPSRINRIKTGIQTACSWLKEIFNLRTPTCSVDINRNDIVVFCMPTHQEHNRIQHKILKRYRQWLTSKRAGCRPVSLKYVRKNISHKKGRRMFVTHRRSLRLEKLK